jgi:HNH endonuclease
MGDYVFSIEYKNYQAKGWIDFYPLQLFADRKSGPIRYRCQYFKQRLIAKATLVFKDDYVDLITDKAEAARLDIYAGTLRFFLRESRGSIKIAKIDWADPGKNFAFLGPAPIVKLVKAEDIEKQREIDRLDRIAKYRPAQAAFRSELLSIYNDTCAVTGCSIKETLQAAHLETVRGRDINDPRNGILLRADIHDLFDAGLLSLSRDGLRIETSPLLTDRYYLRFKGAPVVRPPSFAPLRTHIDAHRRTSGF